MYPSDVIDIGVTAEGLYYLEFRSVTEEDMGRYTVCASNELGSCEADTQLSVVRKSRCIYEYMVKMVTSGQAALSIG